VQELAHGLRASVGRVDLRMHATACEYSEFRTLEDLGCEPRIGRVNLRLYAACMLQSNLIGGADAWGCQACSRDPMLDNFDPWPAILLPKFNHCFGP